MSGRPPKDKTERIDKRPQRDTNPFSIVPTDEQFEPPDWLGDIGRDEFRRITDLLRENKILVAIDTTAIAMLCKDFEVFVELEQEMAREGINSRFDSTPNGMIINSAKANEAHRKEDAYFKKCLYFGITPAARQKIRGVGPEGQQGDEMDAFRKKYGS